MGSFVDLMASTIWTEQDIVNRTEAIIRSTFTEQSEGILNRKVTGMVLGQYAMSPAESVELGSFSAASLAARAEGDRARLDMALLRGALAIEDALRRLAAEPVDGDDTDDTDRVASQAVVDGASNAVADLVALRNPPVVTPPLPWSAAP